MMVARLLSASTPVSPTTAAMAAKAPTGAAHMIIASTRNTSRCRWPMAREDRLAGAAHRLQREADEQGDEQGLEHLARGQRREQRVRDDAGDELGGGAGAGGRLLLAHAGRRRRRG